VKHLRRVPLVFIREREISKEKEGKTRAAAELEGRGRRGSMVPGDLDLGVVEKEEEGAGEMVVVLVTSAGKGSRLLRAWL
jgi:hypothetical protein